MDSVNNEPTVTGLGKQEHFNSTVGVHTVALHARAVIPLIYLFIVPHSSRQYSVEHVYLHG